MNVVAENVKYFLEKSGMKQKKAAELCGYSQKTFNAMLNGRKTIKTHDVIALCNGLGVSPNELYGIQTIVKTA